MIMWFKIKFIFFYIITSPIVVVKNLLNFNNERDNSIFAWRDYVTMSKDPKSYLSALTKINKAEQALQYIFPYQIDNDNKEYNQMILAQFQIHLGILKHHREIINTLPYNFIKQKDLLLQELDKRIREINDQDIPRLQSKCLNLFPTTTEAINVEFINQLNNAKDNFQKEQDSMEKRHAFVIEEYKSLLNALQNQLQEQNATIRRLNNALETEQNHNKALKDQLALEIGKKNLLLADNDALEKLESKLSSKLQQELKTMTQKFTQSESKIQALNLELDSYQAKINDIKSKSIILENYAKNTLGEKKKEDLLKFTIHMKKYIIQLSEIEARASQPIKMMYTILQTMTVTQKNINDNIRKKHDLVQQYKNITLDSLERDNLNKMIQTSMNRIAQLNKDYVELEHTYIQEKFKLTSILNELKIELREIVKQYDEIGNINYIKGLDPMKINDEWYNLKNKTKIKSNTSSLRDNIIAEDYLQQDKRRYSLSKQIEQDIPIVKSDNITNIDSTTSNILPRAKSAPEISNTYTTNLLPKSSSFMDDISKSDKGKRISLFRAAFPTRKSTPTSPKETHKNNDSIASENILD